MDFFPGLTWKRFYVKNVELLHLHHALAFYFYYLLFDFFSCVLQLSHFHFPLTASFLMSLGISPTQFNKDSVLFLYLFLPMFCYLCCSSHGNTGPRGSRQRGYGSQLQTSLGPFSPASLLPFSRAFKIRVLWNNMWIQNKDPQFSSNTPLHYLILAIYHLYYYHILEALNRMLPWEGHCSDRAETCFWHQQSKYKIKYKYNEPGHYMEISRQGGILDLGFATQNLVVE